MKIFQTADTDMNLLKNRGHGHGADKPRTRVSTDLLVRQPVDADIVILINYYSELLYHMSKNWEVWHDEKYTDKWAFSILIIIGIFSPCQDFSIFRNVNK